MGQLSLALRPSESSGISLELVLLSAVETNSQKEKERKEGRRKENGREEREGKKQGGGREEIQREERERGIEQGTKSEGRKVTTNIGNCKGRMSLTHVHTHAQLFSTYYAIPPLNLLSGSLGCCLPHFTEVLMLLFPYIICKRWSIPDEGTTWSQGSDPE